MPILNGGLQLSSEIEPETTYAPSTLTLAVWRGARVALTRTPIVEHIMSRATEESIFGFAGVLETKKAHR